MSDLSNNIAILSYLKDKVHKWKNIAILLGVICALLLFKILTGQGISNEIESGNYIANVKIEGMIMSDDYRDKALEKLAKDSSAKAVLINIDSPGGGIVASEILYNQIRSIAKQKPTVILMRSIAASGGYMAAIASDHIIAHNGTLTGSIGVLMQSAEIVDLAQKLGVSFKTYKSAPLKASPSPFERSNDYVNKVVQSSIKDSAIFFFDLVKQRRKGKIKRINFREIFDGRVFTGRQALKLGLIDAIGDKKSALKYLNEKHKINIEKTPLRDYKIIKPSERILEKLSSKLPFFNQKAQLNGQEIMAIMP